MIAAGSPTAPRNFRIALLAKICADTSRCADRPWVTAGERARGRSRQCQHGYAAGSQLSAQFPRQRCAPFPDAGIGEKIGAGFRDGGADEKPQVHRLASRVQCEGRGREHAFGEPRVRAERVRQPAPRGDLGQARDVDGCGGNRRIGERDRPVAADGAEFGQDPGEPRGIREHAGKGTGALRALDSGDDDERQCEHRDRESRAFGRHGFTPCCVERTPHVAGGRDGWRDGDRRRERFTIAIDGKRRTQRGDQRPVDGLRAVTAFRSEALLRQGVERTRRCGRRGGVRERAGVWDRGSGVGHRERRRRKAARTPRNGRSRRRGIVACGAAHTAARAVGRRHPGAAA